MLVSIASRPPDSTSVRKAFSASCASATSEMSGARFCPPAQGRLMLHERKTNVIESRIRSSLRRYVFWNVNDHGPGSSRSREMKSLVDDRPKIAHVAHQIVVLDAGPSDTDCVHLLESVSADQPQRYLAGDHHDRRRI